jgi:hypothetical protein
MLFFVKRAYYSLQKSYQTLLATCLATDPRPNGKSGFKLLGEKNPTREASHTKRRGWVQ